MKAQVLIADDEPEIASYIEHILQPLGVQCEKALDGREALSKVQKLSPNVVITDVNMPILTGLDFLAALRAAGNPIPVIVISAYTDAEKVRQAWKLGAFDLIDKPFKPEVLLHSVKVALEIGVSFNQTRQSAKEVGEKISVELSLEKRTWAEALDYCKAQGLDPAVWVNGLIKGFFG